MGVVFFILLLLIFVLLVVLDMKLKNSYKLYVIIGNKGTGKTAYMTSLAYKYAKKAIMFLQILVFLIS